MTKARQRSGNSKNLSAHKVDSRIENAVGGILERLHKIGQVFTAVTPIKKLQCHPAVEVEESTPPCINLLSKREHYERLRVLIEL